MPRGYRRKRVVRRRKKFVRRKAPRRTVRGMHTFVDNPLGLLTLTRHYSGSSGSRKRNNPNYHSDQPIQQQPKNYLPQLGRSALGVAGRNVRALGHFADRFLPIPVGGLIGDYFNDTVNEWGENISNDVYKFDNKAANALLSFVDGQDRPGNINKYTDKVGKFLLGSTDKIAKLTGPTANLLQDIYRKPGTYLDFGKANISEMMGTYSPSDTIKRLGYDDRLSMIDNLDSLMPSPSASPLPSVVDNLYQQQQNKIDELRYNPPKKLDYGKKETGFTPKKVPVALTRVIRSLHEESANNMPLSRRIDREISRDKRKVYKNFIENNSSHYLYESLIGNSRDYKPFRNTTSTTSTQGHDLSRYYQ